MCGPIKRNLAKSSLLFASMAMMCMAYGPYWFQPQMVYEFVALRHIGEAQAGFIVSCEMLSVAISAMVLARVAGRVSLRAIAVCGGTVILGATVASMATSGSIVLLISRVFAGLGEGAALAVANATIARLDDPDRGYGKAATANMVFGALVLLTIPAAQPLFGRTLAFPLSIASFLILTPLAFLIPAVMRLGSRSPGGGGLAAHSSDSVRGVYSKAIVLLLIALFGTTLTNGIMWTFAVHLGGRSGLSPERTNTILAIASFIGISGSILAALLSKRFGRLIPVTAGITFLISSIVIICLSTNSWFFAVAYSIEFAALIFVNTYYLGAAADVEPSGRGAAVVATGYVLAGAAGSYLGGLMLVLVDEREMAGILTFVVVLAWLCFVVAIAKPDTGEVVRQFRTRG